MSKFYPNAARDYLSRAISLMESENCADLFYAALELIFAIETTFFEYIESIPFPTKSVSGRYKLKEFSGVIRDAYGEQGYGVRLRIKSIDTKEVLLEMLHIPVSPELQKVGEQLGAFLHAPNQPLDRDSEYWARLRALLDTGVVELEKVLLGSCARSTYSGVRQANILYHLRSNR